MNETTHSLAKDIAKDALLLARAICELGEDHQDVVAFCRAAIAVCNAGDELTPAHGLILAVAIQAVAETRATQLW